MGNPGNSVAGGARATAETVEPVVVAPAPSTLSAEIALLEEARGSLARDPSTALAKVAEHRARYRAGVLADERDLIELDALRRTGRTTDARDRAQAWLARDPSGIHASRVRAILASLERDPSTPN